MLALNEKHLIERTQQGDTEAFSPIVSKYHKRLYTHIYGRVKDAEAAQDLVQEVWLKAFRGIQTFRGESGFSSWLYRIAENVCRDYFRKPPHDTAPLHLIAEHRITENDRCPSHALERAELRDTLRNAINCLSPQRREVFVLYYHHEMPIKAIAEHIGRSEGTVKTHLRNARRQLQELLTPYLTPEAIPSG